MRPRDDPDMDGPDPEAEAELLSKTKKKQLSAELQRLGLELSRLSPRELDSLGLNAELRSAIDQARKIKPGGALKRQIKFIGGLLRELDAAPIRENFAQLKHQGSAATRRHHRLEKWRDRLLEEGDSAIEALMEQVPDIDCEQLRQFIRTAKKETEQGKPPKTARILYRFLAEFLE
jgi:ribosome-associated protein